jgi:hypothetical protein
VLAKQRYACENVYDYTANHRTLDWQHSKDRKNQTKCPKGYYRTIWVSSHPDVVAAVKEYRNTGQNRSTPPGQKCPASQDNNGIVTESKPVVSLGQNCPTTNNNTIKETIKDTTATPAPLPAGGQAPALLADRKAQMQAEIEQFKRKLGIGKEKRKPPSPEEFEQMRRKALEQFRMSRESKLLQTCATTAVSDTKIKDDTI